MPVVSHVAAGFGEFGEFGYVFITTVETRGKLPASKIDNAKLELVYSLELLCVFWRFAQSCDYAGRSVAMQG